MTKKSQTEAHMGGWRCTSEGTQHIGYGSAHMGAHMQAHMGAHMGLSLRISYHVTPNAHAHAHAHGYTQVLGTHMRYYGGHIGCCFTHELLLSFTEAQNMHGRCHTHDLSMS